ncbi:choline-sulfatase [Paenibacillus sp.]|uniref:choline-sulfatase n=1 Tax=Paenibacillus sp. TaxID=58172 RepID=UPI0028111B27|nr:choline-sulfatase [Paenibacillus sp.]
MARRSPNIVMIMVDQMAYDCIGALGHPVVKTPNIDKLVREGVAFSNAYCNSPLCAPSRASFVTGKLPSRIAAYDNGSELPASTPTFLHTLRRAGYETILSGKMHFVGPDQLHGFEHRLTRDIHATGFELTPDWSRGAYPNPGTGVRRLKARAGLETWNNHLAYDEKVASRALEKIRDLGGVPAEERRPFFLCASFFHPHDPFVITEKYWNMYKDADVPAPRVPATAPEEMHPFDQWIQKHHEADAFPLTEEELIANRRAYYGMVTYVDDKVGQLVDELARLRLLDDTVVALTSDHGEMLGERGMWFKRTYFDPSAKVPLVLSCPGRFRAGAVAREAVSLVDLTATFLDLAGVPDAERIGETDGSSFLPVLVREGAEWKDEVVCEYYGEGALRPMAFVRQGRFKYVHVQGHEPLLFDLEFDPDERRNAIDDPALQHTAARLRERLHGLVDFDRIEVDVLRSQRERKLIGEALATGTTAKWHPPIAGLSREW